MSEAALLYRDPTFEAVCAMEANEKRCAVCVRRRELSSGELSSGELRCGVGLRWQGCRRRGGFELDSGEA